MSQFVTLLRRTRKSVRSTEVNSEITQKEIICQIPVDTQDQTIIEQFMKTAQPLIVATLLEKDYQVEFPLEHSVFGFRQMVELLRRRSGSDPFVVPTCDDFIIALWTTPLSK